MLSKAINILSFLKLTLENNQKTIDFDLPNPPQTRPKPLEIEPKSSPEASKSPSREHSSYKHEKMKPKNSPRVAKGLPNPFS